jgi:site-specific recombinase XerC
LQHSTVQQLLCGIENLRDRAMIRLFLTSGLRLSELAQLDIDSISEEEHEDRMGNKHLVGTGTVVGKGRKERRFYFDEEAVAAIRVYLETRRDNVDALFLSERSTRLSTRAIQHMLAVWCERLGIAHTHVHALRHTYACTLANANIDALVLQSLMGHSRFETTAGYFTLADDTKARQYYSAMEFARGPEA